VKKTIPITTLFMDVGEANWLAEPPGLLQLDITGISTQRFVALTGRAGTNSRPCFTSARLPKHCQMDD